MTQTRVERAHVRPPGSVSRRGLLKDVLTIGAGAFLIGGCAANPSSPPEVPGSALSASNALAPPSSIQLSADQLTWALQFLGSEISVDLHCHPGAFFFKGFPDVHPSVAAMGDTAGFEARTISDMVAGGLSVALVATVADAPLLAASGKGLYAQREFRPGEAYAEHKRQLALLREMVESTQAIQLAAANEFGNSMVGNKAGVLFATEGGDFLEEKGERIEEAYLDGVRSIGLVHYHVNDIGDIQTAQPKHHGLTDFGLEAIDEMNRLGILIDLAHATFATTEAAALRSTKPIIVSHSFLASAAQQHPRLLSDDHARLVAATGGLIGAWPSGFGSANFDSFVDRIFALVDLLGIDHVALGTDMDANFKPVFSNYRQLPYLVGTLKKRGMDEKEIAKFLGGNFLRVQQAI